MFGPLSVSLSTGVSDLIFTADLFTLVNCRKTTVFPPWGPPNIMGKLSYISFSVDLSTVNNCSTLSLSDNNDYPVHMLHTHPRRLLSAESAIQSSVLRLESRPVSRPVCRPVFRPVWSLRENYLWIILPNFWSQIGLQTGLKTDCRPVFSLS